MASDRQQQLVFGGSEPGRLGLFLAPPQEAPGPGAKFEEMLEVRSFKVHIAARYRVGQVTFGKTWAWVALAAWAGTTLGALKRR